MTIEADESPYALLYRAASMIPMSHYVLAFLFAFLLFLYNFFECHLIQDAFTGFRGSPVLLTFHSSSQIYDGVVSKCKILHGRYIATPWLASPHVQTTFLNFFGRPPRFSYRRQIFHASDGGNLALDWLLNSDVVGGTVHMNTKISKDDNTPIVMVIPGLTSDSTSPYLKHLSFNIAKHGWNVVVGNHRGLGGTSITSDCFYNAGWTEDSRAIINYISEEYPEAPLYVVGTSIGANVLVKYLGEDGENIPIAGAVAICSPWDLLIGDRFINRKLRQKVYDRALTIGLQGYAQLHQPQYTRLADWEGIRKSRSIRDFDNYATCIVGKFETVDTYYRRCSSASYVSKVAIPLLCVSALDDPVCTREAIPWDECRANKNIVLATTQHGGHLAFFEGISAKNLWWVRATVEFLSVLHSSPYKHKPKKVPETGHHSLPDTSIDQGPFVNVGGDGLVAAVGNEHTIHNIEEHNLQNQNLSTPLGECASETNTVNIQETVEPSDKPESTVSNVSPDSSFSPIKRCLKEITRRSNISLWLLAYIAITTSWPVVGYVLKMLYRKKTKGVPSSASVKR
ncbi:unnamed protein product [Rhodiola kirilowii]